MIGKSLHPFFVSLAIVNQVLKTMTSQDFHLNYNNNQSPQESQRYVLCILYLIHLITLVHPSFCASKAHALVCHNSFVVHAWSI